MGIIKWFAYRLRKNKLVETWTSGEIPDMILPIVRITYPNTIMDKLVEVQPKGPFKVDHYKVLQKIEVYDPRQIISEDPNGEVGTKVIVRRVKQQMPVYTDRAYQPMYSLLPTKTIEILKEYTFEEWDKGLEWKD